MQKDLQNEETMQSMRAKGRQDQPDEVELVFSDRFGELLPMVKAWAVDIDGKFLEACADAGASGMRTTTSGRPRNKGKTSGDKSVLELEKLKVALSKKEADTAQAQDNLNDLEQEKEDLEALIVEYPELEAILDRRPELQAELDQLILQVEQAQGGKRHSRRARNAPEGGRGHQEEGETGRGAGRHFLRAVCRPVTLLALLFECLVARPLPQAS